MKETSPSPPSRRGNSSKLTNQAGQRRTTHSTPISQAVCSRRVTSAGRSRPSAVGFGVRRIGLSAARARRASAATVRAS